MTFFSKKMDVAQAVLVPETAAVNPPDTCEGGGVRRWGTSTIVSVFIFGSLHLCTRTKVSG